jgi:hypothetical protein
VASILRKLRTLVRSPEKIIADELYAASSKYSRPADADKGYFYFCEIVVMRGADKLLSTLNADRRFKVYDRQRSGSGRFYAVKLGNHFLDRGQASMLYDEMAEILKRHEIEAFASEKLD